MLLIVSLLLPKDPGAGWVPSKDANERMALWSENGIKQDHFKIKQLYTFLLRIRFCINKYVFRPQIIRIQKFYTLGFSRYIYIYYLFTDGTKGLIGPSQQTTTDGTISPLSTTDTLREAPGTAHLFGTSVVLSMSRLRGQKSSAAVRIKRHDMTAWVMLSLNGSLVWGRCSKMDLVRGR